LIIVAAALDGGLWLSRWRDQESGP
jgi:hypothetical protein